MIYDVFISYRGADRLIARKLEHRLRGRWGSRVFLDEQSLMAGQSWSEQLHVAMQRARVMLALIGPGWEIRKDRQEKDWVYEELTAALHSSIPILPVFVGNPDDLKHKLADLPEAFRRQAVQVGPELAGFDLHEIGKALRSLGAFQRDKKEDTFHLRFLKRGWNSLKPLYYMSKFQLGQMFSISGSGTVNECALLPLFAGSQRFSRAINWESRVKSVRKNKPLGCL